MEELMVTEAQLIANRENAKLGGVKTEAGKEVSKLNAMTHGLLTKVAVVRGEDPDLLRRIRDNLLTEREPEGEVETLLVERIATCLWRLRRAIHAETAILQSEWDCGKSYPFIQEHLFGWEKLNRYETMIERQMYKAIYELERLQRARNGEKIPAPLAIDVNLTETG
jgi:hypothetical protein